MPSMDCQRGNQWIEQLLLLVFVIANGSQSVLCNEESTVSAFCQSHCPLVTILGFLNHVILLVEPSKADKSVDRIELEVVFVF